MRRRCAKRGHDLFPGEAAREFLPVLNVCLRCKARVAVLPYGLCLGGHPLADHYDADGMPVQLAACAGPR